MKNERKPRTKYSNRCETLRITDSEEKNDSSNDEPAKVLIGQSWIKKKEKEKWPKIDKNNNSSKTLHQDNKSEDQERYQKSVAPSAYKTEQLKKSVLRQKNKTKEQ